MAVLDLGSARFKLTLAIPTDDAIIWKGYKEEVGLGGQITDDGSVSPEAVNRAVEACERLRAICKAERCRSLLTVATAAFRDATSSGNLLREVEKTVGAVSVIDAALEGELFFSAITQQAECYGENVSSLFVADVGGGSVQLSWKDDVARTVSIPTGTFKLESAFQRDGDLGPSTLRKIADEIRSSLKRCVPRDLRRTTFVLGSNCMADFLSSALTTAGFRYTRLTQVACAPFVEATSADIVRLYDQLAGRPYDTLGTYYPANPLFMRGADKALINVIQAMEYVHANRVLATNESLTTSIARMLLDSPDSLMRHGLNPGTV